MQQAAPPVRTLLTARQVQDVLHIDRSTVYRMAETRRLPAIKIGKQWRFPADEILALVADTPGDQEHRPQTAPASPIDPAQAAAAVEVAADILGVMMVVTDMAGRPLTPIANPCPWFQQHGDEPDVVATCEREWQELAERDEFEPRFEPSSAGFECARAFIRSGSSLVGMVLAGGISPVDQAEPGFHQLDRMQRQRVIATLPKIAATISRHAPRGAAEAEEKR